jgi:YVTN family beta-propeller protein
LDQSLSLTRFNINALIDNAYVANTYSDSISVINAENNTKIEDISMGGIDEDFPPAIVLMKI